MRVSEQWLREWVDPAVSGTELAEQLTMAGLEVDGVEEAAPPLSRVVVGRVLTVARHPGSERLAVAEVDVSRNDPLQIVCGAPNVRVGLYAPLALPGAMLAAGRRVERSVIHGLESQGMLCSARELGLAESSEGLLELPADSPPGADLRELLRLDDQIIDVDLTPNRGDCLSIAGIAREVAVLNRCPLTAVAAPPVAAALDAVFPIDVVAPADCPRYVGRVIRGVDPSATTPLWMQERLRRAGLRSLGPLVDVTNYVMLELGQPMHAFDLDKLAGGIVVRRARSGERLTLLNGAEVEPDGEVLVIADHQGAVALAGIMGGEATAVDDATRNLFLESAFFTPLAVAGRPRRFGLQTDSAYRFERGVDPELQARATERATRLLLEIVGGLPGPIVEAVHPEKLPPRPVIRLRRERIARLLGFEVPAEDVVEILARLGMAVAEEDGHWRVTAPGFRFDVGIEADLIEEIGRIYGYDRLPSRRPAAPFVIGRRPEGTVSLARLREALIQRGYHEAITYSFVDPTFQQALDPGREAVALANPISADLAVMRTSLWPGLVKAMLYNQKRQQARVRLFECGLRFVQDADGLHQDAYLGGVVCGEALPEQWGAPRRTVDFFDLKGDVEALLAPSGGAYTFVAAEHSALHPGQTARIERDGTEVGWIGALHPAVEHRLELEDRVFVFELRVEAIRRTRVPRFGELSKFPAIRRDVAVVVDESLPAQAVAGCIRGHAGELLRELRLFDVYRGEGIPENRKSMAFGLILQDFSRTLTDDVVEELMLNIVAGLQRELGATLRV